MQRFGGVKAFVASPPGKTALIVLSAVLLAAAFVYLGTLIAIATFLLFMFATPIYLGWKRPRELAVAGLIAVIIAGPIAGALYAQEIRTPSPLASSDLQHGVAGNGSVLSGAHVDPFTGAAGSTFTFSVTIHPEYLPSGAHGPEYVILYLSTCAGATVSNATFCGGGGYPFWELNESFGANITNATTVAFHQLLGSSNLWWWVMAFVYQDHANATQWIFIGPSLPYGAVQGPVSGEFSSSLALVLPAIFTELFVYVAVVFYIALTIYVWLKSREARKNRPGPVDPGTGDLPATRGPGGPTKPAAPSGERSCPNCGAVIYPSESSCWKCGTSLSSAPSPPLS